MPRLGQHFLRADSVLATIANALVPYQPRAIIEIGPGHGELTRALRRAHPEAAIVAIEKDPRLAAALASAIIESPVTIIEGDARALLQTTVATLAPGEPYCVAGNIPYYLTGYLLRLLGSLAPAPRACVLMVQREVAERATARQGSMNRLAASVQLWARPSIIARVPKRMFDPPPKVDSAVLLLETPADRAATSREAYDHALKLIFAQPRKTLFNNLRAGMADEAAAALIALLGLAPSARPSALSIDQISKLSPRIQQAEGVK